MIRMCSTNAIPIACVDCVYTHIENPLAVDHDLNSIWTKLRLRAAMVSGFGHVGVAVGCCAVGHWLDRESRKLFRGGA